MRSKTNGCSSYRAFESHVGRVVLAEWTDENISNSDRYIKIIFRPTSAEEHTPRVLGAAREVNDPLPAARTAKSPVYGHRERPAPNCPVFAGVDRQRISDERISTVAAVVGNDRFKHLALRRHDQVGAG